MDRLSFTVPGQPAVKGRARTSAKIVYQDGRPMAISTVHSDPKTVAAERNILGVFRRRFPDHQPWTGPVMLRFTAIFETPKSWPKRLKEAAARGELYFTGRPDKDNIEKAIVDALNNWAYMDDSQIIGGGIKRYGSPARTEIVLENLAQPDLPVTPSIKAAEARLAEHGRGPPPPRRKAISPKAGTPDRLQQAIDRAIARDGR